jgi:hypothetical protein
LGSLAQKELLFDEAASYYKEAIQLGFDNEEPILSLMKIVRNCGQKSDIIKFIQYKVSAFRRNFLILKRKAEKRPTRELKKMKKVLARLELKIASLKEERNER